MKVEVSRIAWNYESEILQKLPFAKWFKPLIQSGQLSLYRVVSDCKEAGVFIIRIEEQVDQTKELVLLQSVSLENAGLPLTTIIHPFLHGLALANRCCNIRIHADGNKPGLEKMLKTKGFEKFEVIYKQKVEHGQ